jgi:hypothetical protein
VARNQCSFNSQSMSVRRSTSEIFSSLFGCIGTIPCRHVFEGWPDQFLIDAMATDATTPAHQLLRSDRRCAGAAAGKRNIM